MLLASFTETDLITFWVQLAILVAAALLAGAAARRLGQPAVLGELCAGIVLGPSVLGALAPGLHARMFPDVAAVQLLVASVALLGVLLLVLGAGIDTDLEVVRRHQRAAVAIAIGTTAVPFAAGAGLGSLLPGSLFGTDVERLPMLLFIGSALTVSALPVAARILADLHLLDRPFAQLTMAVAMINTLVAWVIMGVASGMVSHGAADLGQTGLTLAGLAVLLFVALGPASGPTAMLLRRVGRSSDMAPTVGVVLVLAFAASAAMGALRVEPALGAFLAGILLRRSGALPSEAPRQIAGFVRTLLAPVFFASTGLQVDLAALGQAEVALWTAVLVVVGCLSKLVGALLGGRAAGMDVRSIGAIGAGLSARGALGIIVATVGARAGLLSQDGFTVLVLFAMFTTLLAPVALRALTLPEEHPTTA